MKLKLFQVVTLLHPKLNKDGESDEEITIISDGIETLLAADDKQAGLLAARKISEADIKNLSRIEVIVRPF
jgi:hypothetical protein